MTGEGSNSRDGRHSGDGCSDRKRRGAAYPRGIMGTVSVVPGTRYHQTHDGKEPIAMKGASNVSGCFAIIAKKGGHH